MLTTTAYLMQMSSGSVTAHARGRKNFRRTSGKGNRKRITTKETTDAEESMMHRDAGN